MWLRLSKIPIIRILLIVLLSHCYFLQAQWTKQSPLPTGQTITDICFISPDTGWVFGFGGTVFRTNNGGETWINQSSSSFTDVRVGLFLDHNIGWIGVSSDYLNNGGEIYRTIDGGYHWDLQFSDHSCGIRDISFINHQTGWVLVYRNANNFNRNDRNFFLKTINGGDEWFILDSIEQYYFTELDFIDDYTGYIAGAGTPNLMKTIDGGMSWQAAPHASLAGLTDVFFTDANNGYSCGNNLYFTHNSGSGWNTTICYHAYKIDMYDPSNGWTISIDKVYKVTNGGQNADYQFTFDKSVLAGISALDSDHALVAGKDVCIYSTSDGGETWLEKSSGSSTNLNSVFFLNEDDGWAGGNGRNILITHDGGEHWIYNQLESEYPITDIQFVDPDTGFLVNGNVLKSTDGGLNWSLTSGWTYPISDLYFLDSQSGWCVGDEGCLFKTMNGGVDWEAAYSGTDRDLYAVYFVDAYLGWIAGDGIVMKSTNGGDKWEICYESRDIFLKIQFLNESQGYVLADKLCIKTNNGGEEWQLVFPGGQFTAESFTDICFITPVTGYISDNISLMKTTDGGVNWINEPVFHNGGLKCIYFINELSGWAAGSGGVIYHTGSGGTFSIKDPEEEGKLCPYLISPNPSGDIVKITYWLDRQEEVEIEIYTLQGIRTGFYKEQRLNPGSYSFNWDPGDLPSGIYLFKIRIGALVYAKKIVYSK
jgi:photosystem II stability/assembly factor-like uncharacterized protein